ncbi:hypothetical protein KVR01_004433 [Diaporthe batatas]|uniref:uncharacterized protein n=1 Tax=Diaporthe batatas TaxID=748121 RepID=UPI001D045313|nr:uncharacterized protein KVR01_004433 [Diaporthe batatas]KAG8165881.1 hypothetical protein KVR01_004433 [Diaporthe batatas]
MAKRYRHISQMTSEDINLLVRLLCLPPTARRFTDGLPSDQWLARQSEKVAQLPKTLQRPDDWLARLSIYTNRKLNLTLEDLVPQCAVLCAAHKGLNPWIVHRVFLLVSEEVTHRLDPVRKFLENPTKHDVRLKTSLGEVQDYADRMNSILSLWTGPDVFSLIVGENYPPGLAMPRVETDCEACICSCIGAAGQALCDLRAMMYGRSHRRRAPVLIPLVEAWIERFGEENGGKLLAESTRMARDVRHIRKRVMGHRRGHRRHREPYEKRMKELVRMERELDGKPLTAGQLRIARGEIDKKLDETFGKESRKPSSRQGKHASSTISGSIFTASSISKASSATVRSEESRSDRSMQAGEDTDVYQQDDAGDAEPADDYRDEFDEADAGAAYKQQDRLQHWYDTFTEIAGPSGASNIGSQHPAFRTDTTGIENWARSQMAMSAVPHPLRFSRNITPREGDDDDDVFVAAADTTGTQVSDFTAVGVHTLATQSTHRSRRGRQPEDEQEPAVPQVPTAYLEEPSRQGGVIFGRAPSSVYSNDAPTALHPPPAVSSIAMERPRGTSSELEQARGSPPSSRNNRHRPRTDTVDGSAVTAWPCPGASPDSNTIQQSRGRMTQTSQGFQAGLDQLGAGSDFALRTTTLGPDDSVSAVAGIYRHVPLLQAVVSERQLRQSQIDADAALARRIQEVDLLGSQQHRPGDESEDDDDDEEELRTAIAISRETARRDLERRSRAGRGQFSDLYMPDSSWI